VKLQALVKGEKLGKVRMLAVSPDAVDKVKELATKVEAKAGAFSGLTLLSDADHKVIEAWGILNEQAAARGRFLPHPATFVIDAKGRVHWRFIEKDYKVRPTNEMVLDAVRGAQRVK